LLKYTPQPVIGTVIIRHFSQVGLFYVPAATQTVWKRCM